MPEINAGGQKIAPHSRNDTLESNTDFHSSTDASRRNLLIPDKLDRFVTSLVHRDRGLLNNEWDIRSILSSSRIREQGLSYGQLFDTLKKINLNITEEYGSQVLLPALREAFPGGNHEANIVSLTSPISTIDPYSEFLIPPMLGLPKSNQRIQEQPKVSLPDKLTNIVALKEDKDKFLSSIEILGNSLPIKAAYALTSVSTKPALNDDLIIRFDFRDRTDARPLKPAYFYVQTDINHEDPNMLDIKIWRVGEDARPLGGPSWKKTFKIEDLHLATQI